MGSPAQHRGSSFRRLQPPMRLVVNPLIVQIGIAGPMVLGLAVHAASRRGQGAVQRHLFWLLLAILSWMVGTVLETTDSAIAGTVSIVFMLPATVTMTLFFFLMMAHYARIELFEQDSRASWALAAPFGLFFVGFLTNSWHGLMLAPGGGPLRPEPFREAGAFFWAFLAWTNAVAFGGLAICAQIALRTRSRVERRRMGLLFAAALAPMAAHTIFVFDLLGLPYPLTPASLGITALLVVAAIHRYSFLELQPVARRDVIEASCDGVIVADSDECVVDSNPAATVPARCDAR